MITFSEIKQAIGDTVGLANDALHVYVALIAYLGTCWLFRWSPGSPKPWLFVLAITLLGEFLDINSSISNGAQLQLDANWLDIWNTMLAPTMLLLAMRYTSIFRDRIKVPAETLDPDDSMSRAP